MLTSASTWNSARAARGFAAAACLAAAFAGPVPARGADEEGCLGCHGLPGLAVREAGAARPLGVSAEAFDTSMHGELGCRECHADIASIPHGEHREAGCGQPCHGQTRGGKEYSHEKLYWEYTASVHGRVRPRAVGCLVCHPAPERRETADRDKLGEAHRCAACHRDHPLVRDWFSDRHYLALAGGNRRAPSCPDCHSAHRVRAASADDATVSRKNLAGTCANGAVESERRGGCHGALGEVDVTGVSMSPLPRGTSRRHPLAFALLAAAGSLLGGLVVRAGLGLWRGR